MTIGGAAVRVLTGRLNKQDDRIDQVRKTIEDHKLHVAETFTPKRELVEVETRLRAHADERFDDLRDRIDAIARRSKSNG